MELYRPMTAKAINQLPAGWTEEMILSGKKWIAEKKYDGIRAFVYKTNGDCMLYSRNMKSIELPWLKELRLSKSVVLDGEIFKAGVRHNEVSHLISEEAKTGKDLGLQYAVFDIIEYDDENVVSYDLVDRRALYMLVVDRLKNRRVVYPEWRTDKEKFFAEMLSINDEGIMLKNISGLYETGRRSEMWIKWKTIDTFDVVITDARLKEDTVASREEGKLILFYGYYIDGKLTEVGSLGYDIDPKDKDKWVGKVVEMTANHQFPKTGALMHARNLVPRWDKDAEDCRFYPVKNRKE